MAAEMFCWPNALIELPDNPSDGAEMIKTLASDTNFLRETRIRNVSQMCQKHDWRYRIREIYEHFGLPIPQSLESELFALGQLPKQLMLAGSGSR